MEESKEEWKGFIIIKQGPYWRVRNCRRWVGGTFTRIEKARLWINAEVNKRRRKFYKSELRRIRKIEDIRKRAREYKKLCQIVESN